MECGQLSTAAELLKNAIRNNRGVAAYHANLGRCLVKLQQTGGAMQAVDAAMALDPKDARTLDTIGVVYSFLGYHEDAANAFRQAVKADPDKESYWHNFGASLKFAGQFDAAEDAYGRALELNPQHNKARAALSHMRRQTADKNHIEDLSAYLKNYTGELADETRLGFALAKEYDDVGLHTEAFQTLSDFSQRWRQSVSYTSENDQCVFRAMQTAFTPDTVANAKPGDDSSEPMFIMGMPRTGTTLTERILSAHSDVYSAGETGKMSSLVRMAGQLKANADFKPAILEHLLSADLAKLGAKYLEVAKPGNCLRPHFVDKTPLNFLYAGFIMLALPNAKIVAVRRNPMDSCLSNFRQLFSLQSPHYQYSYDILDCGRYYLQFDQLMRHWEELFPGRILTVQYEDLVEDQEQQSRRLISHCGLDWEDACLEFEKNTSPVATASAAQVREPVFRHALSRWKNYRSQLEPLEQLLREGGVDID
jgi:tetratricopeptide (TPR) repeat protein